MFGFNLSLVGHLISEKYLNIPTLSNVPLIFRREYFIDHLVFGQAPVDPPHEAQLRWIIEGFMSEMRQSPGNREELDVF